MKISHLNGLRALEATLRNGTFSAAAAELGVTVAAVGQQIRGLEDYVGVRLFDRLPSGVQPTAQAHAVASKLFASFAGLDETLQELRMQSREGCLSLAMPQSVLDDFLAPRMTRFHASFPEVKVSYQTGEEYVDLIRGGVDMAIRFSPEPGPEYAFDALYKSCSIPICTLEFAEKFGLSPEIRDLSGVPLFRVHDLTTDPQWVGWTELLRRHGLVKAGRGPVEQVAGYRVALSGEGLLLCGLTEAFNDLAEGRIVAPLGPGFVTPLSYGYRLVWSAGRTMTRPMKHFRQWLNNERSQFLAEASHILGLEVH